MRWKKIIPLAILLAALAINGCGEKDKAPKKGKQAQKSQKGIKYFRFVNSVVGLNMRAKANENSKKIGALPYAARVGVIKELDKLVKIGGVKGRWTRVVHKGKKGWVFGAYLTAGKPETNSQELFLHLTIGGGKTKKIANKKIRITGNNFQYDRLNCKGKDAVAGQIDGSLSGKTFKVKGVTLNKKGDRWVGPKNQLFKLFGGCPDTPPGNLKAAFLK